MQYHHNGYTTGDPRILPARPGRSLGNPFGDKVDVLVVGAGPAAVITAAQLGIFPHVSTRIIERSPGKLTVGRADGLGARSVETFYAFRFGERILSECEPIPQVTFYGPDPDDPNKIIKDTPVLRDALSISARHLTVNQARVIDYFVEFMEHSPARISPEYGLEFLELTIHDEGEYPVESKIRRVSDGSEFSIYSKYVLGADGGFSRVRESIGQKLIGKQANHAWGVIDGIFHSDLPDIRTVCNIHSSKGNILLIPREGGFLTRFYVSLGDVEDESGAIRKTPMEEVLKKANEIIYPYTLEIKDTAWFSIYEVGHRITTKYDNLPVGDKTGIPRVFNAGDACHTHSAKAGQGMNVSMQDGWNLAWKLGYVLEGWADPVLLRTYDEERRQIGQDLIDFDVEWSAKMAQDVKTGGSALSAAEMYVNTTPFQSGTDTLYRPSILTSSGEYQKLATGYTIGKRFHSAKVLRVCDKLIVELGRTHEADGKWRIYVFADASHPADTSSPTWKLGDWLLHDPASPLNKYGQGEDNYVNRFIVNVIYQQSAYDIDVTDAHEVFRAKTGKWLVPNYEYVFAQGTEYRSYAEEEPREVEIFQQRGISKDGAVILVRPEQYVGDILPLDAYDKIAVYFDRILI